MSYWKTVTAVTFDGTPAAFTVVSPTLGETTVPAGATTGAVVVTTAGGKLTSNISFRVSDAGEVPL
jgi:hypothetical protein